MQWTEVNIVKKYCLENWISTCKRIKSQLHLSVFTKPTPNGQSPKHKTGNTEKAGRKHRQDLHNIGNVGNIGKDFLNRSTFDEKLRTETIRDQATTAPASWKAIGGCQILFTLVGLMHFPALLSGCHQALEFGNYQWGELSLDLPYRWTPNGFIPVCVW